MMKNLLKRVRIEQRLFSDERSFTTIKQGVYAAFIALPLAALCLLIIVMRPTPPSYGIDGAATDTNRVLRVQFFAQNYLTYWLTGTPADDTAIRSMLADSTLRGEWNPEPVSFVSGSVNLADLQAHSGAAGTTEWVVKVGATTTAPGSDAPKRNFWEFSLVDRPGSAIRALGFPRATTNERADITVTSPYVNSVSRTSPIGVAVTNFAGAFYTSESGALGRFVSSGFHSTPIVGSPYTGVDVVSIRSTKTVDAKAQAGTRYSLLATIKGTVSTTTWQVMSVPLTVLASDTGQWVVDALDDRTKYTPEMAPK